MNERPLLRSDFPPHISQKRGLMSANGVASGKLRSRTWFVRSSPLIFVIGCVDGTNTRWKLPSSLPPFPWSRQLQSQAEYLLWIQSFRVLFVWARKFASTSSVWPKTFISILRMSSLWLEENFRSVYRYQGSPLVGSLWLAIIAWQKMDCSEVILMTDTLFRG